ncbi:MAG TPA: alkane 1-monooxygenase [Limnobacter sp.]|uniref:alkane 1-monooxygenase n=1 Tax=Limnobacter sp. TaxID=2003368 RepID=UPI002ED96C7F
MLHYLKFTTFPVIAFAVMHVMFQGGPWMYAGIVALVLVVAVGDLLLPEDRTEPRFNNEFFLNFMLWLTLPLLMWVTLLFSWGVSSHDVLGIDGFMKDWFGYDRLAIQANTTWYQWFFGAVAGAFLFGAGGTNVGHELTHRTYSPRDMILGRWMLAFTCDASFAIEHVYGHHKNLGTPADPATAQRGDNVYTFVIKSWLGGYRSAWKLEKQRLAKFGYSVWDPIHSRMMRGNLMSLSLFASAYVLGGWWAVAMFWVMSAGGKTLLEIVNYMEHYGIVRRPEDKVEPRHSWNTNASVSTALLYALTRHSHHHAEADQEYWNLRSYRHAPMLPTGYLGTILLTLVPPLYKRVMTPLLNHWDEHFATPEEKKLAIEASLKSGMKGLKSAQLGKQQQAQSMSPAAV